MSDRRDSSRRASLRVLRFTPRPAARIASEPALVRKVRELLARRPHAAGVFERLIDDVLSETETTKGGV